MKFTQKPPDFYGIRFLVTAVVFFSAFYLVRWIDTGRNRPGAIRSRIEKVLAEKVSAANTLTEKFRLGEKEVPENSGITIFEYDNDTLASWSGNAVPGQPAILTPGSEAAPVMHLDNGWYRVLERHEGATRYRAFILISQDYAFQNDYLVNGMQKDFRMPGNIGLSLYHGDIDVFSPSGMFLFSVTPGGDSATVRWPALLFFLFLAGSAFAVVFLYRLYRSFRAVFRRKWLLVLLFAADLVLLRGLQFFFRWPRALYETPLFGPGYYFSSAVVPSFGDLIVDALVLLAMAIVVFLECYPVSGGREGKRRVNAWRILFSAAATAAMMLLSVAVIRSLVGDSTVPMDLQDLTALDIRSAGGFGLIAILFLAVYLVSVTMASGLKKILPDRREKPFLAGFSGILIFLVLCAAISTVVLNDANAAKEKETRRIIAMKLAARRNPVTEELFIDAARKMEGDTTLSGMLNRFGKSAADSDEQRIVRRITSGYFDGYWINYSVLVTLCPQGKTLRIQPQDYLVSCSDYFESLITSYGRPTASPQLFYLDYGYGNENYLARIAPENRGPVIYIEFTLKQSYKDLGYPELLVDRSVSDLPDLSDYSYGYYQDGQLVRRVGKFAYGFELASLADTSSGSYFFDRDGLNHFFYRIDRENVMLIGKPDPSLLNRISPFSYLFIFFSVFSLAFYALFRFGRLRSLILDSLRNRLQMAFLGIILSSFIMVGVVVTVFLVRLNVEKDKENLLERALSILVEMQHKFGGARSLELIPQADLAATLTKFSNVFFSDINVYGIEGRLAASSRPQIFDEGLVSDLMNPKALERLKKGQESMIVTSEHIGKHHYLSAYLPMYNDRNELTGYINLPYFSRQADLRGEVSAFMVAFINIYVLFILLGVLIAFVIAGYLTAPLKMLAQKIGHTTLGRANEKIEWKRQDEVGRLVGEYNRMLDELLVSAGKLASSERESAWREMARQVAHEIKNPLTPMKLSIQHLEKSWFERTPDWDQRLKRFTAAMVEQIDSLSAIATEFSDFAKMPPPVNERLELNGVILAAVGLYRDITPVRFTFEPGGERFVFCDRKQLLRVFTNLLNNAIQAIGEKEGGEITVSIAGSGSNHEIRITDNGPGIPSDQAEKIFHPNFTTKSGGTGLGLAIVREIVQSQGGTISFEPAPGTGTTFILILPGV